jgi:hypothetical protein
MGRDMPDSKHLRWQESFGTDTGDDPKEAETPLAGNEPAANDADGWQEYRRWISKAPTTRNRRAGIDPALYSWKGYREWTDHVRRNWAKESSDDE